MSVATKERPILMSAPMVNAILEGAKTQTRRVMKPQPEPCGDGRHWWPCKADRMMIGVEDELQATPGMPGSFCPHGAVGDRLWVRETWALVRFLREPDTWAGPGEWYTEEWAGPIPKSRPDGWNVVYRADGDFDGLTIEEREFAWRPSIFMPRWASRITLEITEVKVERLRAISEADATAEGVDDYFSGVYFPGYLQWRAARANFRRLWESINGPGSWALDPWVWVLTFRRVEEGGAA